MDTISQRIEEFLRKSDSERKCTPYIIAIVALVSLIHWRELGIPSTGNTKSDMITEIKRAIKVISPDLSKEDKELLALIEIAICDFYTKLKQGD